MKTAFQVETFDAFYRDAMPLLELHRSEIAKWKDIPLGVDVERYRAMEQAGTLRIFTVRHPHLWVSLRAGGPPDVPDSYECMVLCSECGIEESEPGHSPELLGYAVFFVGTNPHYRSSLQAVQDVLYLHPDMRRGRTAVNLIRFSEAELKREGVQVIYQHVKLAHPALGILLAREGYEHIEHIYAKRIA